MGKLSTEFVGTFFLVLVIGLSGDQSLAQTAVAVGGLLAAMIYMGWHVSGAHYNPAVTLALVLRGSISGRDASLYMLFQVMGAVCASLMVLAILGTSYTPGPGEGVSGLAAVLAELLFAFAMTLVILRTATGERVAGNSYYGLAIGLIVMVAVLVVGPISGAVLNPAVGLGPVLVDVYMGTGGYKDLWIYVVGPFSGAALAVVAYGAQGGD